MYGIATDCDGAKQSKKNGNFRELGNRWITKTENESVHLKLKSSFSLQLFTYNFPKSIFSSGIAHWLQLYRTLFWSRLFASEPKSKYEE